MPERKLPASHVEELFALGYMHERALAKKVPDYGYQDNSLPKTSGKERETVTMFSLTKENAVAEK